MYFKLCFDILELAKLLSFAFKYLFYFVWQFILSLPLCLYKNRKNKHRFLFTFIHDLLSFS